MIPISQYIAIEPHPVPQKTASGLFISKVPPTKATVVKVSQDIVDSPIKPGDTIAYIDRCKWIAGECLLNVEMVLAIL